MSPPSESSNDLVHTPSISILMFESRYNKQRGVALMIMLIIMVVGALAYFVSSLNNSTTTIKIARDKTTADALAQAKAALIGYAVSQSITSVGDLRLPDLGYSDSLLSVPSEGSSPPNFTGNTQGYSLIGKFPWKSFGTPPLRDGYGECLWYVLSGWFKNTNLTSSINWDTTGQIDVIDGNGNVVASNIAALLIAPGQSLDSQNRALSDSTYSQCGGGYDAQNYLDSYNSSDAVSGEVNYFIGSTNNRLALNTNNKQFVMTKKNHYNDQFLFVTVDDIFRPIIRRSDFTTQVTTLMNDADFITHLQSITISGAKGTDNVDCTVFSNTNNETFCTNWKAMLLLTSLSTPSPITIDGAASPACNRVLIFGGQKTSGQVRLTTTDKSDPSNFLESVNLTDFATPTASSSNFSGSSTFSASNPSADLLVCIP